MRIPNPANLEMVRHVAERLGTLRESVVFVGGAVVDLLITDPVAPAVRPTTDVDVIVEVASLHDYHRLGNLLRALGFREDSQSEGGPVCRWIIDGIKVDTMPMIGQVLGFSNAFYSIAVETAVTKEIGGGLEIRLISAPCFLATKIEAFLDRGKRNFMESHDLEDLIAVVDGRPEIVDEIENSPVELRGFLAKTFRDFLREEDFLDAVPGLLPPDEASQKRVSIVLGRIESIASSTSETAQSLVYSGLLLK
jgi:predicted nucleotidyltransferase